jgi:hypothetical protein
MKNRCLILASIVLLIISCEKDMVNPLPGGVDASVDIRFPVISLIGSSSISIERGTTYSDAGATASDNIDGDITSSITTSGLVDTSTPGTYTITYSVSDAAGNSTSLSRTVIVNESAAITALAATGVLSEQTPAEAKKTISGKWNINNSSKSFNIGCEFDYIEFTDDYYLMALILDGETVSAFGSYVLNEDSEGNVNSVDLNYNIGGADIVIATLTDISVTMTGLDLFATFTVDLDIPEAAAFDSCNSLDGTWDSTKQDPMPQSYAAAESSSSTNSSTTTAPNTYIDPDAHVLLINNSWELKTVTTDGITLSAEDFLYDDGEPDEVFCDENYENCSPPTSVNIQFSAYGSYNFVFLGSFYGPQVEPGLWSWIDEPGSKMFYVYGSDDDPEDYQIISINVLTEYELIVTVDSEEGSVYSFVAL